MTGPAEMEIRLGAAGDVLRVPVVLRSQSVTDVLEMLAVLLPEVVECADSLFRIYHWRRLNL
jgi:hypothetical protein